LLAPVTPEHPWELSKKLSFREQFKSSHEDSKQHCKKQSNAQLEKLPDEILSDEIPQVSANWLA
jgi:hypothetical protein